VYFPNYGLTLYMNFIHCHCLSVLLCLVVLNPHVVAIILLLCIIGKIAFVTLWKQKRLHIQVWVIRGFAIANQKLHVCRSMNMWGTGQNQQHPRRIASALIVVAYVSPRNNAASWHACCCVFYFWCCADTQYSFAV